MRKVFFHHFFNVLDRSVQRYLEFKRIPGVQFGKVQHIFDALIVDDLDVVTKPDDTGRTNPDILYDTAKSVDFDKITHMEVVLKNDEKSCQNIRNQVFGSERDSHGKDSYRCKLDSRFKAEKSHDDVYAANHCGILQQAEDQGENGIYFWIKDSIKDFQNEASDQHKAN